MIDEKFKIIFFNGGFAGDLITALHNPLTFNRFSNRKIVLADGFYKLKSHTYRTETPIEEKIEYEEFDVVGTFDAGDMDNGTFNLYDFKTAAAYKWTTKFGLKKNRNPTTDINYKLQLGRPPLFRPFLL